MVEPLPHVREIPPYVPGKPPVARAGLTTYKLSSNENPYPPLPSVRATAEQAVTAMNRYPDMGCSALYDALATKHGVGTDQLAAGTGSVALIYHLLSAYCGPGDEVVHAWRSFEAYPIAITAAGATGVKVPVTADGRHDLPAMAAATTERTKVVLLCTPNNPTGPALTHAETTAFIAGVPADVLVVVDEAYVEFVRMADPVDGLALLRDHPNVVLLRTFSKAYGLAGLRVGYAVAAPEVATALRAVALPFGVSSVAQAAAVASLAAEDELLARVDALVVERDRLVAGIAAVGWTVPEPQGNFVWFDLPQTDAFAAAAGEAGLAVRPFAGEGVRVSVGEPEATDRLVEVLRGMKRPT
ncbi:histidinol-phosphate transaminase [Nocardioides immobilis]|uniref:Aromatic amino acid aminotransferase n=1 Tax=Nocardioides immobilis TaxID=2049295 RepID=A0A417Y3U9_9ACTN|nr:histidinol-phosphate transaminase [Nocardioides immobilis]RHW27338.1 histidinol-phosphate transaminase [Nocardioides immobilis]